MNRVTDIHDSKAVDEFIENENAEDNHSWHYYQKFIDYLGKGSLIVGIAMLICFFWNVILK